MLKNKLIELNLKMEFFAKRLKRSLINSRERYKLLRMLWDNCIFGFFKESEIKKNYKLNAKFRSITTEERDKTLKEFIYKSKSDFIKHLRTYRILYNQFKEGSNKLLQQTKILKKPNTDPTLVIKFPHFKSLPSHNQLKEIILKLIDKKH